jgi:hypothetical protein
VSNISEGGAEVTGGTRLAVGTRGTMEVCGVGPWFCFLRAPHGRSSGSSRATGAS